MTRVTFSVAFLGVVAVALAIFRPWPGSAVGQQAPSSAEVEAYSSVVGALAPVLVDGEMVHKLQPGADPEVINPVAGTVYTIGAKDLTDYHHLEFEFPTYMSDENGGTIRLIMQHETQGLDELRMVDLSLATEFGNDTYGSRGRHAGLFGWCRQVGGGEYAWILGDNVAHILGNPWDWAFILDYNRANGRVLGGRRFRVYSHPHVTTRVVFMPF